MQLKVRTERWPLRQTQRITGYSFTDVETVFVSLSQDGLEGRGEANGVYYRGEEPAGMVAQIEAVRRELEAGPSREALRGLLPAGGARNAVDCALWELESKRTGRPVWELAGLKSTRPVPTTRTIFADSAEAMAEEARELEGAPSIKLKLLGDDQDAARIRAVREVWPDVWLCVDANQGFDRAGFAALLPVLVEARVRLIEQPFPAGDEALLDGLERPIPVAADESVQGLADLPALVGRFDVVNLKLDKSGGLTEALLMAREARRLGLGLMTGCMIATSLAMAPAFVLAQLCDVADVDGPLYLSRDREPAVTYAGFRLEAGEDVWGRTSRPGGLA